jgi:hypothetical protein
MSTLSGASTLAQVKAAYDDNASYEEDASAAKCRAFVTAGRILLRRVPKRAVHGGRGAGEEIEIDPVVLRDEVTEARRWLARNPGAAGTDHVIYADFSEGER